MSDNYAGDLLGAATSYPERYSPELLVSIPRAGSRAGLGIDPVNPPFNGVDLWTAYELSWLEPGGKPRVAIAEFSVDCHSAAIIESKSLKLYLNSLNQTAFASVEQLRATLCKDLGRGFGGRVDVAIHSLAEYRQRPLAAYQGCCLDDLALDCHLYQPQPALLKTVGAAEVQEMLYSDLVKTNCPVTGQPDWATVVISYRGRTIDRAALLAYLVSYRQHQGFHENAVESMFMDILRQCRPNHLEVFARYTRRGGVDINPCRTTGQPGSLVAQRSVRQ